jgi:hypothetical protein
VWADVQVVRVYGSHAQKKVIQFEHEVLGLLQQQQQHTEDAATVSRSQPPRLSFRVPRLVPVRDRSGTTYVHLVEQAPQTEGRSRFRYVAMFDFIEGSHPSFDNLAQVNTPLPC